MPAATGAGPLGLYLEKRDILCINRTGATLTVGDCLKLAVVTSGATEVADNDQGQTDSGLANVVDLAADSDMLVVIALEPTADNEAGLFRISGHVKANVDDTGTTIGLPLEPFTDSANKLGLKGDTGSCVGIVLVDPGTADAVVDILFDGIHGFGGYGSAI